MNRDNHPAGKLHEVWEAINVLGAPDSACTTDDERAYCRAIGDALEAVEALAQRAASPVPEDVGELDTYDAGLLNDFGGGDVGWWHDYIRAELGRAHDFYADLALDAIRAAMTSATPKPDADAGDQQP